MVTGTDVGSMWLILLFLVFLPVVVTPYDFSIREEVTLVRMSAPQPQEELAHGDLTSGSSRTWALTWVRGQDQVCTAEEGGKLLSLLLSTPLSLLRWQRRQALCKGPAPCR